MRRGIGVIGVGVWGCHSLEQTLRSTGDARVVAVSTEERWGAHNYTEPPAQRGREYAEKLGAEFRENWRDVIGHPEVDIVSAMVCPKARAEVVIAALESGKHVVIDKPLAFTVEEARRVCDAESASSGRGFMLAGYHPRPLVARLVDEVAGGRLGEIKAVGIQLSFMGGVYPGFTPTAQWRSEIPSAEMTTIGSHALVTLFKLLDETPETVYALLRNQFYESYRAVGAEDWAELNLPYASGAVANVMVSRLPHKVPNEDIVIEVTGTEGYAHLSGNRLTLWPGEETVDLPMDGAAALRQTFEAVHHALASGGPMPTTFHDGLRLQLILDAALRSAETRGVVCLA